VKIHFMNGSTDAIPFSSFAEAHHYCRRNISYSGGRVRRVEVYALGSPVGEAVYDINWDQLSKSAGLRPRH
jgi:hypothetical protein